jgi:hypothetical protein
VPELLNNFQPDLAVTRPLAGIGAGAFLCEGAKVGAHAGDVRLAGTPSRLRGTSVSAVGATGVSPVAGVSLRGGYQPSSRIPFNHTTPMFPVRPGNVGPHPAREPDPV